MIRYLLLCIQGDDWHISILLASFSLLLFYCSSGYPSMLCSCRAGSQNFESVHKRMLASICSVCVCGELHLCSGTHSAAALESLVTQMCTGYLYPMYDCCHSTLNQCASNRIMASSWKSTYHMLTSHWHDAWLTQVRTIDRICEIPHEGPFCDLVWSDPEEIDSWAVSPRGAGWLFGNKVVSEFNQINGGCATTSSTLSGKHFTCLVFHRDQQELTWLLLYMEGQ